MNINDLYFANISMITKKEYRRNGETAYYHETIRQTIVKPTKNNRYIDLLTGKKYKVFGALTSYENEIGCLFINGPFIPFSDIISVEKQNMSKRRILKKFNDYKNQVKEKE